MARRYALRDDQWGKIEPLLPGREETPGATAKDNRLFVDAVLYRYRAGIPWRDLPERFGDWNNVAKRHRRWSESGVWEKVFARLSADADNEYAAIDSTIVRAHPHAGGAKGGQKNGVHRAVERQIDHENTRQLRCPRQPDRFSPDTRTGA